MMAFERRKLGDFYNFKAGTGFPKNLQGKQVGDFPFAKVSDMNSPGNEITLSKAENYISNEQAKTLKAYIHTSGSVAFAKIGVALTSNRRRQIKVPVVLDNNMMSAEPKGTALEPRYGYYLLCMLDFNEISCGSALPYLTVGSLKDIDVLVPNKATQRKIAAILGALDDRIELNRKTAATLEEMARALYRSWFVDFDPVHAKAAGRAPAHMDAQTASIFPDSFGDDGLPKGWEAGTLADISLLNPSKHSRKNHPAQIEYVDLANTKWGLIEATTAYQWEDAPSRARMSLAAGDTIVGTVRPGNGSFSFVSKNVTAHPFTRLLHIP